MKTEHSKYEHPLTLYSVGIVVGEICYLYPIFSANHHDAVQQAAASHAEAFGPLPWGTRILVYGQCRDSNCNCGGEDRGMELFTTPTAGYASC